MHEMILCKLGEVVLKGLNRRSFEDEARWPTSAAALSPSASSGSTPGSRTIYVEPHREDCDLDGGL